MKFEIHASALLPEDENQIVIADGYTAGPKNRLNKVIDDINLQMGKGIQQGTKYLSRTIITREPNEIIGEVHDRMPVILTEEQVKIWLNTKLSYEEMAQVLQPIENSSLLKCVVGKSVNKAANKSGDWFGGDNSQRFMF